jgi:hypothetical protein
MDRTSTHLRGIALLALSSGWIRQVERRQFRVCVTRRRREMDSNRRSLSQDTWVPFHGRVRSRPSSWWRFETKAEAPGVRRPWWNGIRSVTLRRSAINGTADCAASGASLSSPAPLAHRCAAAGLDSGTPAERLASMPFDGAVDRLRLARPRMGSAGDRLHLPARSARPSLRPGGSGAAAAIRRFARAAPRRSAERSRPRWGKCQRRRRGA